MKAFISDKTLYVFDATPFPDGTLRLYEKGILIHDIQPECYWWRLDLIDELSGLDYASLEIQDLKTKIKPETFN